ncbi:MAG: ABC transporter substrate-binding protein [Magnetovibrionaceae bacterium]
MLNRRFVLSLPVLGLISAGLILFGQQPAKAADTAGAETFITELAQQAVESLTGEDIARDQRIANFRTMFQSHFAVDAIGKWVLGRNWRKASETEQAEYLKLFEDLMIVSYVDRFSEYAGQTLQVTGSSEKQKIIMVSSDLNNPGSNQPIRVDWRVGERDGGFKILDVVVQGTSMSATLRSEFGSIIKQKGGSVAGLIEVLKEKTAELSAS